jgi:putative ABC transport system ATP-binding protein
MTSETRPQPLSISLAATLAPERAGTRPAAAPTPPAGTAPSDAPAGDVAAARAPILEARDVTKRYELGKTTVEALRGVSLAVAPGEFVALMGPSGSGKSTLLQLLGGLDQPTTGSVVFEGVDISHLSDAQATKLRRERTGFVFQAFNLIPLLSVRENIELPFTIAGGVRDARDRVRQVIELVELAGKESHRPDQLSAGEQQRVAVARALVTRPSVLLADEPTGNLDYTNSGELLDTLWRSSEQEGQTIVLVTHDARAAAYADRVLVIGDGRIEEEIDLGRRADHSAAPLIARLAKVGL